MFITWNGETQNEYYGNKTSMVGVAYQLVRDLKKAGHSVHKAVVVPCHRMAKISYVENGSIKHVTVGE